MSNMVVRDGDGTVKYMRAKGDGSAASPFVLKAHDTIWQQNENYAVAKTNEPLIAAPAAGLKLYVTHIIMSAEGACNIKLVEDTGGGAVTLLGPMYFAANGGMVAIGSPDGVPILVLTAAKDLGFTSSAAVNHTVFVAGYTDS